MTPQDAYLKLALTHGLGPVGIGRLMTRFGDPAEIFSASMADLREVEGIGSERARAILDPKLNETLETEKARCRTQNLTILTPIDELYPPAFAQLYDPPCAIWMRGTMQGMDRLALAVVGPRHPTVYGHRMAQRLTQQIARLGVTIISGLARGIDTVAHQAALEAGGRTIAVLGSGLNQMYPSENQALSDKIAANGAVISEFPLDTRPDKGTFPRRNRLVAALSLGVLVIEAGPTSGSLITARLAAEQGRDVLVLPGPIDRPEHQGSNRLIKDGATMITSFEDILEQLPPLASLANALGPTPAPKIESNLTGREQQVYALLSDEPRTIDDLVRGSENLPPSAASATLISLELKRIVRKLPGGYIRAL